MHHVVGPFLLQREIGRYALLCQSGPIGVLSVKPFTLISSLMGRQDRCDLAMLVWPSSTFPSRPKAAARC